MSMFRGVLAAGCALALVALVPGCGDDLLVTDSGGPAAVASLTGPLSGAIFTTLVDGTRVNANIYPRKEDVYLDGGPGPNAPSTAAGLPAGDYYFQVTDPSGKDLLSTDHISCRRIRINEHGVIDSVYAGTNYVRSHGSWSPVPAVHGQGVDIDHPEFDAITVQLMPYDDTPNRGGVYKVWITPVDDYAGDETFVPTRPADAVNGENYQPGNYHGFIPRFSKTDNYKVRGHRFESPTLDPRKFHDRNLSCAQDVGEEDIAGWLVYVTDPLGVTNNYYTPALIQVTEAGTYILEEELRVGSTITAAIVDGAPVSCYPTANPVVSVVVAGTSGEHHDVVFGNVGIGQIKACKVFDRNANGVADEGEPGVPGWHVRLEGLDARGNVVGPLVQVTGEGGCTTFGGLAPGTYTLTELMPANGGWTSTGATSQTVTIESALDGGALEGTDAEVVFTNVCLREADFDTKGYWHNKNGLEELTSADIAAVNGLDPYDAPSSYFGNGDEPFDGLFTDGTPVSASLGQSGELIAPPGSFQAEISQFLVDGNAGGDPREQLAQQLLAFIFNVRHRLDGTAAAIELPDGTLVPAGSLIDDAIAAWASGTASEQTAIAGVLDALNNNDAERYVPTWPCEVVY